MYRLLGLDEYDLKARLAPVIASVAGVLVVAILLLPAPGTQWPSVVIGLLALAIARGMTQSVRDRGKRLEGALYAQWGGKPSTAILRHADTRLPETVKIRYHRFLARHVPELRLPTEAEKINAPERADAAYEAGGRWLLEQTRNSEHFRLLFTKNVNHRFRRNLLAAKPVGLLADGLAAVAVTASIALQFEGGWQTSFGAVDVWIWSAGLTVVAHFIWLALGVTPRWVRVAAEQYAEQLLAACDALS